MPYGKKRSYRRRPYARRRRKPTNTVAPWYARKYSPMQLAKYAAQGVWKLKGLVNSELKKFDINYNASAVLPTGFVSPLMGIAQGDTSSTRDGNSIFVRSLNGKLVFTYNATAGGTQYTRVAIVIDTQQISDTDPGYSDIYDSAAPDYTVAHLNPANVGRFKILWTTTFFMDSNKTGHVLDINIPMRHHIRYNGTTAADYQKGGLYLVYSGNVPAPNYHAFTGQIRISFHDN